MSIVDRARPEIRELQPYRAAEQLEDTIRLNANESPWAWDDDRFRRPLNRYPEVRPRTLRDLLARRYGCPAENLLVTRGTSEGIDLLIRAFCRPDRDSIVTVAPTFSMYEHYARVQSADCREYATSPDDDFAIDVKALLANCDDSTRLLFLCSPNNPTGNVVAREVLLEILEALKNRAAVVVDEAYIEFSRQSSSVDLLSEFDNLIVLRTLSKALACAGARCGSVLADRAVVTMLEAVQAPYAMATPVVECVEDALQSVESSHAERLALEIAAAREELMAAIAAFPMVEKLWPSAANFFLMRVNGSQELLAYCGEQRVLLRDFGSEVDNCIRVTVGNPAENERLLAVLEEFTERST